MTASETHRAIEAVWRIESAKLIAGLARIVRDVGLAEDLAQDALVAALEQWPASGVPDNPGAWLMTTAKRRAIDAMRRDALHERKHAQIGAELEDERERAVPDLDAAIDDHVGDDLLQPHLHRVSSGSVDRRARRAHAAPARWPDDRRDRARVSRPRADDRAAHRPREEDARRAARPVRGAARRGVPRAAVVGAPGDLSRVQRGLLGDRRRRLGAPRALRGRASPRSHSRGPRARRRRGPRPRRADGDSSVAAYARARVRRANRCCCSIRIGRGGTSC